MLNKKQFLFLFNPQPKPKKNDHSVGIIHPPKKKTKYFHSFSFFGVVPESAHQFPEPTHRLGAPPSPAPGRQQRTNQRARGQLHPQPPGSCRSLHSTESSSSCRIQNVEPLCGRGQLLEEGQVMCRPLLPPSGKQIGPVRASCFLLPTHHHHQQPVAISSDPDTHPEVRGHRPRSDAGCGVGPSGESTSSIGQHNTPDPEECPHAGGRSMIGP